MTVTEFYKKHNEIVNKQGYKQELIPMHQVEECTQFILPTNNSFSLEEQSPYCLAYLSNYNNCSKCPLFLYKNNGATGEDTYTNYIVWCSENNIPPYFNEDSEVYQDYINLINEYNNGVRKQWKTKCSICNDTQYVINNEEMELCICQK
jgi:hypothetical protein